MENTKKEIRFEHQISNEDHFIFAMLNEKNIGYAWFKIKENQANLCYISVDDQYRKCHIASGLLDCIEIICREKHVNNIIGKFYPEIDPQIVLDFYEKNGYSFFRDGYEQMIQKNFFSTDKTPEIKIIERTNI